MAGCGGEDKDLHPCDVHGYDNPWCDDEGRTNVCTIVDDVPKWTARACTGNWYCDDSVGNCLCTPGDTWCLSDAGRYSVDAAMTCNEDGRSAQGPACWFGCGYEDDKSTCLPDE